MHMKLFASIIKHRKLNGLVIPFLALPLVVTACNKTAKTDSDIDSAEVVIVEDSAVTEDVGMLTDTIPDDTPVKKTYTTLKIGKRNIKLPGLADLKPITDKISADGKKIKSVSFYGLTPSGGLGSMTDDIDPFTRARNLAEAKKYSQPLMVYEFDRDGNIEELDMDAMYEYEYKHDVYGRPTEITSVSGGYRGCPSYVVKYTISWDGETPTDIKRKIEEFESEFSNSSELEFETDFTGRTSEFVKQLVKHTGSKVQVQGNTAKFMGEEFPVWCEVIYY